MPIGTEFFYRGEEMNLDTLIARHGGWISVETFMRAALFDHEHGYYARRIATVGRRGDFATSATLSDVLGIAIARWLWRRRPRSLRWHVIELGPGTGALAATVLRRLGWIGRIGLCYHAVEIEGSPLQEEHGARLRGYPVRRHTTIESALAAANGEALIFSNEFFDAFPVRVFQRTESGWAEVGLEKGPVESLRPATELPESTVFRRVDWARGQRVEVAAEMRAFLMRCGKNLRRGAMLTIDYGERVEGLFVRRLGGSLRGYFLHERVEGTGVFQRFGRQDLTADVNFSDLIEGGEAADLRMVRFLSQREYLEACGVRARDEVSRYVMDPGGPGSAFKVVEQERKARGATG